MFVPVFVLLAWVVLTLVLAVLLATFMWAYAQDDKEKALWDRHRRATIDRHGVGPY